MRIKPQGSLRFVAEDQQVRSLLEWLQRLSPAGELSPAALTAHVLLAVFLIVVLARVLGGLMLRIGQPRVVGEIFAGICLGPTFLGETLSSTLAPPAVKSALAVIATLALILFMFLAGVKLDVAAVNGRVKHAGILALLSVAIPALVAVPLAIFMHTKLYYGPVGTDLTLFVLFLGAALSVTAFPVMAHILMERGELNSPMGSLGVAAAAIMSVLMFAQIAFVAALAKTGGAHDFVITTSCAVLFIAISWLVVRPCLRRVMPGPNEVVFSFAGMILYGFIAHIVGINALVGGFLWGIMIPADREMRQRIAAKISDLAMILFLPIFFAMAGFSTDLTLLTSQSLLMTSLVLMAAIAAKFVAVIPGRLFGLSWRQLGTLGALFNTRGLLVLVVGLIGLQQSILSHLTFTIIVIVALVTNLTTLPLLTLFAGREPDPA